MAVRWAITGGTWSSTSTWNDGATLGIPTTGDDVWSNGFTVNMDTNATVNSLNNSARSRDIATPQMTANNAPSPFVAAASSIFGGNQPFEAFNRNYTSTTYWTSNGLPSWLSIDFGSTIVIDGYTIFGSSNSVDNPRNWTFEGSNNNTSWNILHTVTSATAIPSSGSYSIASIGNVTAYRYYRVNISANGSTNTSRITELELYQPGTAALAAGGSFNFNTSGVSVTGSTFSPSSSNLINVSAVSGNVSLTLLSSPQLNAPINPCINHSGNCNLTINSSAILGSGGVNNNVLIGKTSLGNLIVNSFLRIQTTTSGSFVINSNSGTVIINGDVIGNVSTGSGSHTINHVGGNLIVNGNVQGSLTNTTTYGINSAGTSLTVNGNVTGLLGSPILTSTPTTINGNIFGGTGSAGISTTAPLTISGSVFARAAAGISTTSAIAITVSGDVYASATANGISSTNASGIVNLTGNMYNSLGRNAIYCPNIFISNSATTLWRMDIGGGLTRTLYSADSFPNLPSTSDVRRLVSYGPASGLTGTMWVASPSDIRKGVLTDNTVGTADITATDILNFINTSSDPLAVRMKTMLTDNSAGQLISEYNFV